MLNYWFWLVENVLRCAIIFREKKSPNDFSYFKGPYRLQRQKKQNPQRHWL